MLFTMRHFPQRALSGIVLPESSLPLGFSDIIPKCEKASAFSLSEALTASGSTALCVILLNGVALGKSGELFIFYERRLAFLINDVLSYNAFLNI